jgi:hypothetical protein
MMDLWLFSETKLRTKFDTIYVDENNIKKFDGFITYRLYKKNVKTGLRTE